MPMEATPLGHHPNPEGPVPAYTSSSFPSLTQAAAGYPLGHAPSHEASRFAAQVNLRDSGNCRLGSVGSGQQHPGLQPSQSSLGRSSLPPSVSKYLAELEQHQVRPCCDK